MYEDAFLYSVCEKLEEMAASEKSSVVIWVDIGARITDWENIGGRKWTDTGQDRVEGIIAAE